MTEEKMPSGDKRAEAARQVAMQLPEDTRLTVTAWVFYELLRNLREGGTFRWLIYDRLGFSEESGAYHTLHLAGGLVVNNLLYEASAKRTPVESDEMDP